jgi:hypothetical protein
MKIRLKYIAVLATLAVIAGCTNDKTRGNCPDVAALVDASTLTAFKPGTVTDPTFALYTAEIVKVDNTCSLNKRERTADSSVEIDFRATRPPTGEAAEYTVPYFVVIRQGAAILSKRMLSVHFAFAPGEAETEFSESIDDVDFTAALDKRAVDYQILVGFQLTKQQLDYNRAMGRFAP